MRFKYLLLWLIISLIGIFNFSSAWVWTIYCDKDTSACSTRDLSPCCSAEGVSSFTCTSDWEVTVYRTKLSNGIMSRTTITCPTIYNVDTNNYKLLAYWWAWITQWYHVWETNIMPVSILSPVVDWLEDSIIEFIPYVIYVWLWLLSALIWFISIKWLINWVRWKSLWVFRFKLKK